MASAKLGVRRQRFAPIPLDDNVITSDKESVRIRALADGARQELPVTSKEAPYSMERFYSLNRSKLATSRTRCVRGQVGSQALFSASMPRSLPDANCLMHSAAPTSWLP